MLEIMHTKSDCYKANRKIKPKGIMVHSTGANNPYLRRYVGTHPELGTNQYNNDWNRSGVKVAVHAFIGYDKDKNVKIAQVLPWDMRGWHSGKSANDTHISFEICESNLNDKEYFDKAYQKAIELCVMLCKEFNLSEKDIIDHAEGYKKGIASNHADVGHWFPKHGKSMNTLRADVKKLLEEKVEKYTLLVDVPVYTSSAKAKAEEGSIRNYKAGEYFVYNKANSMINITKTSGSPGGWINPKDNVKKEEPVEEVETPVEEDKKEKLVEIQEPDLVENKEKTWKDYLIGLLQKIIEYLKEL